MYKIVMITLSTIMVIAWIVYGIYRLVVYFRDKNKPERTTEHLRQVRGSFDEYMKKLEKYEKKPYDRQ
jgi:heme/copper-type cytochrome/quinol oxidase subunit 2